MERSPHLPDAPTAGGLLEALVEAYAALGLWLWQGVVPDRRRPGAYADRAG